MKKILYVASSYGHILSFHVPYIKKLQEMDFEVHVAAAGAPENVESVDSAKTTKNQKLADTKTINIPFEKSMLSPKNLDCVAQLVKLIKKERYDIISVHTSLAAFFVRLAVMLLSGKKPIVINTVHGYLFDKDTPFVKRNIFLCAEKLTKPATDVLVVMNQQDYDIAQKYHLYKDKLIKIPGVGIDTERFSRKKVEEELCRQAERAKLGIEQDDIVMIYAAEFSKRKNQKMLIEAMAKLPTNVKLFLAGKGDQLEECQKLAENSNLNLTNNINTCEDYTENESNDDGDRVTFLGHVKNLEYYYYISDICVSSSRSEGLPFNIMEAMSMGLPVIATNVKGHQDLIAQDVNGYLYEFDDSNGFVDAVMQLMNESTKYERTRKDETLIIEAESKIVQGSSQFQTKNFEMSQNNIIKAQEYGIKKVLEQVMAIYKY